MSVETTLKAVINPLLTGGCHNLANTSTTIVNPYAVFYEISGMPVNTITSYSGLTKCRYQVDVFARTPEQAKSLALGAVKEAIEGSVILQGTLIFQMSGQFSALDKTYQYITEYTIWAE